MVGRCRWFHAFMPPFMELMFAKPAIWSRLAAMLERYTPACGECLSLMCVSLNSEELNAGLYADLSVVAPIQ
ncbi:hypothetical protein BH10ACI4_BH10ACI4_08000 [soil metagenome]